MHQILCTLTMGLLPSLTVRFWRGSQVFSSTGYPNHFTKYFTPRPTFLTSRIASTSYSKWSSSIVAGGGGGGFWEGNEGDVWSQQQLIEDPVDSPCPRKLEPVPCRPHLLLDCEGSCTFVVQLLGGAVHLQVLCVQPDQVPLGILLTQALAHIIAPLHCNHHFLHCLLGCSSRLRELGQPLVHCWVHFCGWVD